MKFQLQSPFQPTGDQPQAIQKLVEGVNNSKEDQVLLGVTGSGKTFTMANVIAQTQKPTLILAHNKTLAAQLYQEFRDFFPNNAVSYFVSYYDYYQPEAYIPSSDTYIEKEADINDEIDKLRLAATTNLITRPDVIVVASVSCIYNLGSPVEYGKSILRIMAGEVIARETLMLQLSNLQYERSTTDLRRGSFRLRGDIIQVWPAYQDTAYKIDTLENTIVSITEIDPVTGAQVESSQTNEESFSSGKPKVITIFPAKHYQGASGDEQQEHIKNIEYDLKIRVEELQKQNKPLEAYRLQQKVNYDLEMIREFGFVNGIENYSRYFDGRKPGEAPFTLLDYFAANSKQFHNDFLTFIDESHITVSQVKGMYFGDRARKENLIDYGFRLPSAIDNRPLRLPEFLERNKQIIYVSATPKDWELNRVNGEVVEQLIRPTGLVDPLIELRPIENQIESLIIEILKRKQLGQRVLVTTLTKKMAEALTNYLNDQKKIDKLVQNYLQRLKNQKEFPDAEHTYWNNELLPVDDMEIGKIDTKYYHHLSNSSQGEKLPEKHDYPKVAYLHSDIETLERSDILADLRKGEYDVVVGINLLREGLDLPEVSLVAVLDADKEGFLRSATSLIQTMGRAARHENGKAILFADRLTGSMQEAISETQRRRTIQVAYNQEHNITPTSINKPLRDRMLLKEVDEDGYTIQSVKKGRRKGNQQQRQRHPEKPQKPMIIQLTKKEAVDLTKLHPEELTPDDKKKMSAKLRRRMKQAANDLDFELATLLRDTATELEK